MRIINTSVCAFQNKVLVIGFEGENERTQVRIDASEVFTEYPNAAPSLTVKPNSGEAYPVLVNRDGTDVVWDITSSYLTERGECEIQLTFIKDSVVCKSYIGKALVLRSLTVEGEMPTPVESWVDAANAKLAEVDAQITELEGMVDTATDAAERAAESAEIATEEAVHAEGSAETATAKANEATQAAGTATAKAAEAALSATQANNSAVSAADSERGAIAKAAEATTAAGTATAKAEQATEAAQTATEKAGDASASARAAHASEISAAESADDALSAEVGANAAKRAAEASATQAGTSERNAGTAAQTATQKAAEATQSATDAETFAGTATTRAEEAAASAQAASDAKTAVEETAEQLADSLEQIEQNTQDIAEHEQYAEATYATKTDLYKKADIIHSTASGAIASFSDGADGHPVDELKVSIEPVQDLHGYDHPWPAGGGKNKLEVTSTSTTRNGVTITVNSDGTISLSGTATDQVIFGVGSVALSGEYILSGCPSGGNYSTYFLFCVNYDYGSGATVTFDGTRKDIQIYVRSGVNTNGLVFKPMIRLASETDATFAPYSNICPITGWTGATVTRTGKNIFNGTVVNGHTEISGLVVGETYTISAKMINPATSTYFYLRRKVYGGEYTTVEQIITNTTVAAKTFTVDAGYIYAVWSNASYANVGDVQIELGSTATDYEPYAGNTYDITLPTEAGTVYGGELTINADGSGSLVVDKAKITLDGTQSISSANWRPFDGSSAWLYSKSVTPNKIDSVGRIGAICDSLEEIPYGYNDAQSNESYIYNGRCGISSVGGITYGLAVRVPVTGLTSANLINAYLAENPIVIVYPLATPVAYTLTASEIRTLLGQNNIWSDAGDVSVKYNADTKLYIDNKIAELVARIVNS